jgi:hypothetical protein
LNRDAKRNHRENQWTEKIGASSRGDWDLYVHVCIVFVDAPQVQGRSRGFDYSDREPIMAAESDDDLPSATAFPPRGGYGSSHPPSNMFDDL